ncbi:MAG: 16S rRNA (guanine(966)-N(2))-methyltransferase RsmD [Rhodanobacter sp.]|jgi:16S rRNA (guanine966-N2)-methyltransferase|nr:16S rRNA (guanine(966)-N(2))-methyltransferase RsmD [Rhodanobacter sp.]
MPNTKPKSGGNSVRIVAGHLRGSRLHVPDIDGLRPSPDRVRETLFNWLAPWIAGMRCLDLYAGTGALGIEALSRGAGECVFVERDRTLWRLLQDNLARLHITNGRAIHRDAADFLAATPQAFDLVFLDPPFPANLWSASAQALEERGWLCDAAMIYVESPQGIVPAVPARWIPHREGHAGAVRYALYRRIV